MTDSRAVTDFVANRKTRFGRIGICVTNSSGPPSNLFKNPLGAWRAALGQLRMSTIYFAKDTLPRMQKKSGCLITITSPAVASSYVNGASIVVDGGLVRSLL